MDKGETLEFLDDLIAKVKAMTPEEFAAREKELGIDRLVFNPADYEISQCSPEGENK